MNQTKEFIGHNSSGAGKLLASVWAAMRGRAWLCVAVCGCVWLCVAARDRAGQPNKPPAHNKTLQTNNLIGISIHIENLISSQPEAFLSFWSAVKLMTQNEVSVPRIGKKETPEKKAN